jgi:hypothetical protein
MSSRLSPFVSGDEGVARFAASLNLPIGMSGVTSTIDATMFAVAVGLGGGAVLTSVSDDIK